MLKVKIFHKKRNIDNKPNVILLIKFFDMFKRNVFPSLLDKQTKPTGPHEVGLYGFV